MTPPKSEMIIPKHKITKSEMIIPKHTITTYRATIGKEYTIKIKSWLKVHANNKRIGEMIFSTVDQMAFEAIKSLSNKSQIPNAAQAKDMAKIKQAKLNRVR